MPRTLRRRDVGVPLLIVALCLLATGALLRGHIHRTHVVQLGERLPSITLTDLTGSPAFVQSASGTTVFNVFATWCVPCRQETPAFAIAARTLQAHGVRVVGIDQGESASRVEAFVSEFGLNYPVLIDDDRFTNSVLGARVIPETLVVHQGVLAAVYVGPLDDGTLQAIVRSNV